MGALFYAPLFMLIPIAVGAAIITGMVKGDSWARGYRALPWAATGWAAVTIIGGLTAWIASVVPSTSDSPFGGPEAGWALIGFIAFGNGLGGLAVIAVVAACAWVIRRKNVRGNTDQRGSAFGE